MHSAECLCVCINFPYTSVFLGPDTSSNLPGRRRDDVVVFTVFERISFIHIPIAIDSDDIR